MRRGTAESGYCRPESPRVRDRRLDAGPVFFCGAVSFLRTRFFDHEAISKGQRPIDNLLLDRAEMQERRAQEVVDYERDLDLEVVRVPKPL